ncbi:hypothetical protein LCM23_18925 [Cytobacillus kochii]|uniref:hypothetical protein n=1 Tax=Cytobacillus kochii TaxID=859143 RepID=UPI001CD602D6|nr:hypothetical protein [Cytobacillus kochii]MCA1028138.1 hypothetical protein [Cytobacillus kochii]
MACKNESCFDVCLKLVVNTNSRRAETSVECDETCGGIEFEFENGVIQITLPLVACVETTLKDDLSASAELTSLSLPGYQ